MKLLLVCSAQSKLQWRRKSTIFTCDGNERVGFKTTCQLGALAADVGDLHARVVELEAVGVHVHGRVAAVHLIVVVSGVAGREYFLRRIMGAEQTGAPQAYALRGSARSRRTASCRPR